VRWLITGAQGFIGRYVTNHILACQPGAILLGVGRSAGLNGYFSHTITGPNGPLRAPLPDALASPWNSRFRYCSVAVDDVPSMTRLLAAFRPDIILHLASSLRGQAKSDLLSTNVGGTEALFASILLAGGRHPRVVLASSGGVYGEVSGDRLPSRESDPCHPIDDYSISKLLAENSARRASAAAGISLAVVRIFNVLGPGQSERHVAGQIAAQLMPIKRGCTNQISLGVLHCTRDFIDVRDAARAVVTACCNGEGTFNIGTGKERSVAELLNHFLGHMTTRPAVQSRVCDGGLARNCAEISRMRDLGFEPEFSLDDSVTAILDYYERIWEMDV